MLLSASPVSVVGWIESECGFVAVDIGSVERFHQGDEKVDSGTVAGAVMLFIIGRQVRSYPSAKALRRFILGQRATADHSGTMPSVIVVGRALRDLHGNDKPTN